MKGLPHSPLEHLTKLTSGENGIQEQWTLDLKQSSFVLTRSNEIRGSRELHDNRHEGLQT